VMCAIDNNHETVDDLLHGELKIIQRKKGVRYSADALLLAHFSLPFVDGKRVLDMGCGNGVVALIIAQRGSPKSVTGVEIQQGLYELARRNAELNRTDPPVKVVLADAIDMADTIPKKSMDIVVTNPPFRRAGSGRVSPDPERAISRHEIRMDLPGWFDSAIRVTGTDGTIFLVYPVSEQKRLEKAVREKGLHIARRQYALDRPEGRKRLVLVMITSGKCETEELPAIPIETEDGKFSLDGYR